MKIIPIISWVLIFFAWTFLTFYKGSEAGYAKYDQCMEEYGPASDADVQALIDQLEKMDSGRGN